MKKSYSELSAYFESMTYHFLALPQGSFRHPCIVVQKGEGEARRYVNQLWDWGKWANNIALCQITRGSEKEALLFEYEKGSVLNFLDRQREDGSIDIVIACDEKNDIVAMYPIKTCISPFWLSIAL